MKFQVLRGAIFTFVDGLEERILDGVDDVERTVSVLIGVATSTISGLIFNSVDTIINETFNLFRAGLAVIFGRPAEDEEGN
ncbi:hypothetical protein LCGC14_3070180 [marine sediment metagenome]|uniref:Uncharacterized protein n=1 Tax=marine sediment metagenome TaxID=412755 RepID=A0A0F8YP19_9ZZZZ